MLVLLDLGMRSRRPTVMSAQLGSLQARPRALIAAPERDLTASRLRQRTRADSQLDGARAPRAGAVGDEAEALSLPQVREHRAPRGAPRRASSAARGARAARARGRARARARAPGLDTPLGDAEAREARRAVAREHLRSNSEFGFDFLRDNMKLSIEHERPARRRAPSSTRSRSIAHRRSEAPLIISGAADADLEDRVYRVDKIIPGLKQEIDFVLDERARRQPDSGGHRQGRDPRNRQPLPADQHRAAADAIRLSTRFAFKRDKHYVVEGSKVVIVDPHTGRPCRDGAAPRSASGDRGQSFKSRSRREERLARDDLHQPPPRSTRKLSRMTGRGSTPPASRSPPPATSHAVIPRRPIARLDHDDGIYKTAGQIPSSSPACHRARAAREAPEQPSSCTSAAAGITTTSTRPPHVRGLDRRPGGVVGGDSAHGGTRGHRARRQCGPGRGDEVAGGTLRSLVLAHLRPSAQAGHGAVPDIHGKGRRVGEESGRRASKPSATRRDGSTTSD